MREKITCSGLSGHAASLRELKHQTLAFDVGLSSLEAPGHRIGSWALLLGGSGMRLSI